MYETQEKVAITRVWAMPSRHTFRITPIRNLLSRYITHDSVVVDPFCGESRVATRYFNDLRIHEMTANRYLDLLIEEQVVADIVLLDPPYSPRQISECYKEVGKRVTTTDTQNAKLYADAIRRLDKLLRPDGIAIRFGWNSCGFGVKRGYELIEMLLVCHGGAHNDTIVTVERKISQCMNTERS